MASRKQGRWLILSDLQIPYEHEDALNFAKRLQKEYRIDKDHVCCVGDEVDNYFISLYKKSPNALHTPGSELQDSISALKKWYRFFPSMMLSTSNHGDRLMRKAYDAEIPSQMLRTHKEILEAPPFWQWDKRWIFDTKYPWMMEHGDDWGSQHPHFMAAVTLGMSVVMGHHHSKCSVSYIRTALKQVWGAVIGSMIDVDQYAFDYCKRAKYKPVLSNAVVLDNGHRCDIIPYR